MYFYFQIIFVLKKYINRFFGAFRKFGYQISGLKIGKNTFLPKVDMVWPHQVTIGFDCKLENDISFKYDGINSPGPSIIIGNNVFIGKNVEFNIRSKIEIGSFSLIASGVKFIDHDHGFEINKFIKFQNSTNSPIKIGEDVLIGANSTILSGVTVGNGAIIGAGAVLKNNVGVNEIWAGVPAKLIAYRN